MNNKGFTKRPKETGGGYQELNHPDGSVIWICPNGEVVRIDPKIWTVSGDRKYTPRYSPNGNVILHTLGADTHSTGEFIKK